MPFFIEFRPYLLLLVRIFTYNLITKNVFQVQQTLISDDVASAKFACHLTSCLGACCVVGEGGAPIEESEVTVLKKAYIALKSDLTKEAIFEVESGGLIRGNTNEELELACIGTAECVFVVKSPAGVSQCSIQKAFYEGRFNWEKPISCHLFPIRIMQIGDLDFMNFEYVPEICSSGKQHGLDTNTYLAEYLEKPLTRKYGQKWFEEFIAACNYVRSLTTKSSA